MSKIYFAFILIFSLSSGSLANEGSAAGCECANQIQNEERRLEERLIQRLLSFDEDGDGTVSVAEYKAGQKKLFIKHNKGWDRKLGEKELNSLVDDILGLKN